MPTLFSPEIPEAAHPGSNTDRLYVCQGSGADRDRHIERLDLFTDQMPAWAGSLGAPAHDTASTLDTTSSVLVLDKNGAPKKAPIDYIGIRGYRIPNTGVYALKWKGATGAGSTTDASVSAVTGAAATARSGITMSSLYPGGSGMYLGAFSGLVATGPGGIVSSARQVELGLTLDTVSTDPDDQMAVAFMIAIDALFPLGLSDLYMADVVAFNPDSGAFARLQGHVKRNTSTIEMRMFNASGGQYLYSDLFTLLGASSYVFLRFAMSSVV